MKVFCKDCGIELRYKTFPFGFFDNCVEFKEDGFIGNFYCYTCTNRKLRDKKLAELDQIKKALDEVERDSWKPLGCAK